MSDWSYINSSCILLFDNQERKFKIYLNLFRTVFDAMVVVSYGVQDATEEEG